MSVPNKPQHLAVKVLCFALLNQNKRHLEELVTVTIAYAFRYTVHNASSNISGVNELFIGVR